MKKVGIIGNGFVGEAQAFAFSPSFDVKIYDIDPLKSVNTLTEVLDCDVVFVCVPTPMTLDGSQDISYVENVFKNAKPGPTYIIKSTVTPGTTLRLQETYPKLDIVFSPEFLTQRTAKLDMMTQARVVIGGSKENVEKVKELYDIRFKNRNYVLTDTTTAELIKYMNNSFFATKVSIMNEFKLVADKLGADWEKALHGFAADSRIGDSHLDVPGPDGKLGYGGACFPKDVNAFTKFTDSIGVDAKTIKAGWETNKTIRKEWK